MWRASLKYSCKLQHQRYKFRAAINIFEALGRKEQAYFPFFNKVSELQNEKIVGKAVYLSFHKVSDQVSHDRLEKAIWRKVGSMESTLEQLLTTHLFIHFIHLWVHPTNIS